MYKRFGQLSFVIGLFFLLISLILFANMLLTKVPAAINLYTAVVFFLFGVAMMLAERKSV